MNAARWFFPSLSHWLWVLMLLMLLSDPWRTAMVASDGDACMHWRVGEWMLQNRQIVQTDTFSHTKFGQPVISKEWLSEIIYAGAGRVGGLFGLAVVAAVTIATTFALLHRQLLRDGSDFLVALMVSLLALWAASGHWLARPHVFSFLMLWLWNTALRRWTGWRLALALLGLMVLWVNLHGAFLVGLIVLGVYGLGAAIERRWRQVRQLAGCAALCAGASLINPSGYQLHIHNLAFLRSDYLTNWLAEYSSANFHSAGSHGFLAWLALIFFTLVICRPRLSAADSLMLIVWGYFGLFAGRNVPLLVILSAPILAPAWSGVLPESWRGLSARLHTIDANSRGWPVVAAAAVAIGVFLPRQIELPADRWPVAAVQYIRQHPQQFTGNMFNQYVWGGYLLWELPEHRTFVDGRTDFFGEDLIREFSDATALRPNWTQSLAKYDIQWTLMPTDHPINRALALWQPRWSCIYSDQVAMVWRKTE